MEKLWTKNFSMLTIGSFVSTLGTAAAGFAFGILIYQKTGSPLSLALFTVANIIPRIITGFIAGPYIDRHSRKKTIVGLNFLFALFFMTIAIVLFTGYFNVIVFTLLASVFGVIDSVYQLSFLSIYPEIVTRGNHSRAYSLYSITGPLSIALMAPIAAYVIDHFEFGIAYLLGFNMITYLFAAVMQMGIHIEEKLNQKKVNELKFLEDLKEGFHYYKIEKGIMGIAILFAAFSFVYASQDLLRMPYFVSSDTYTLQHYSFLLTASSIGRIIGGIIHYTFKYPPHKRFIIAVFIYLIVETMSATTLYMPYVLMLTFSFIVGLLSVTSYNIRMAATQVYIPTELRGRVNSTQNLLWHIGGILGALSAGFLAEYTMLDYRFIVLILASVSITSIFLIPIRMKPEFIKIYNADV